MGEGPRLVTVGTINNGATLIQADATTLGPVTRVTLTKDYTIGAPDGPIIKGFPSRPAFTGSATAEHPHTIPSGTTIDVLKCEADALIAALADVAALARGVPYSDAELLQAVAELAPKPPVWRGSPGSIAVYAHDTREFLERRCLAASRRI